MPLRAQHAGRVLKATTHTNQQILAENFLRTAEAIVAFFERHERPFIASVTRPNEKDWALGKPGHVRMWRSHQDWLKHRHQPGHRTETKK